MASSDLTMQLLMAANQPQQQDPATAAAIPRLQLAQQLMQQGTDASPTSKWGGISRLAAALTGNYIFDKASTGLQDAYKDLAPQLASTLPEGHPLIKALNSPSPMVRFQATQAWQKMMPMLGGVDKLSPGQTPMVAGQPLAGPASGAYSPQGAQAAAVTAPIAGANKNAELPATIAAQNNEGNVESTVHMNAPAVLSPGQTRVAPTQQPMPGMTNLGPTQGNHLAPAFDPATGQPMPNYPTTPNGPHAVPGYNPGHPTPPLPVNGAANPLLGPISGQGPPLSPQDQKTIDAMLAHNPPLPANYKTPASVSAVPPMVTPQAPQPQPQPQSMTASMVPSAQAKIWENMAGKDSETVQKDMEKASAGMPALGTTATIRTMQPDVKTGVGADARLLASQWGAALGVSPENMQRLVGTNPVMGELLQKKLFELSTGAVRGMGAREPGSVISMFQKNYPNLSSRDMTIDAMTRLLDMDQIRNQDYASAKQQFHNESVNQITPEKGYRGLSGFDNQFDQANNPRVYAAAALASGKLPFATWSKGLSAPEQTQALKLAGRVWPDAGAFGPGQNGQDVWHTMGGR